MGLIVIIGFDGPSRSSNAFPVYVGQSGTDAAAAMQTSSAQRFLKLSSPLGINKNNSARDQAGVHVNDQDIWDRAIDKRKGAVEAARKAKEKADAKAKAEADAKAKASKDAADALAKAEQEKADADAKAQADADAATAAASGKPQEQTLSAQ